MAVETTMHAMVRQILFFIYLSFSLFHKTFVPLVYREYNKYRTAKKRENERSSVRPTHEDVFAHPCVFVLSTGRCGTELLTRVLARSSLLDVEHSPDERFDYLSCLVANGSFCLESKRLAVIAGRFERVRTAISQDKFYVETNNSISLLSAELAYLFPNSKFIHLVRDPFEFVSSGLARGYYGEDSLRYPPVDRSDKEFRRFNTQVEKIAFEWKSVNLHIENFKRSIDPSRVLTIESKSFFSDPKYSYDIFKFIDIPIPFNDRFARRVIRKPINSQPNSRSMAPDRWTDQDRKNVAAIVNKVKITGFN